MPPPSQKNAGQASISAFFKPKAGSQIITKASQPDPVSSNGHARTSSFFDGEASSSGGPALKRPRASNNDDERPRRETIDRMGKWKFTAVKTSSSQASELGSASQETTARSQKEQARHEAFRKKLLGSNFAVDRHARNQMQIEEMSSRDPFSPSTGAEDDAIVVDDDEDYAAEAGSSNRFDRFAAGAPSSSRRDSASNKTKGKGKAADPDAGPTYTPLEKQILELKAAHPGVLLIIEVGYKLKFYGEDARIASKELNIMCFPERNLLTAMIPVHRLHIHVKRLIQAGHKVGVVRQIETRALKAASKNAYTPFVRKLTALYTASTWIDDLSSSDDLAATMGEAYTNQPKSLLAIVEQSEGGNGPEDRVSIGIISVEVNTGHLTYDQFTDGHARTELETRIAHLAPAEVLVPPKLTKPTEKVISYLLGNGAEGGVRIERLETKPDYNQAFQAVTHFYRDRVPSEVSGNDPESAPVPTEGASGDSSPLMSVILSLPHLSLIALAQIIQHLQAFQLESICTLSTNFLSFSSRTTMLLNSNTLANLEIFRTADEQTERGSLIWLLDKCKTAMGRRLLRKWVSKPLTDVDKLEERLDAVQSLRDGKGYVLRTLPNLLHGLPDLERGLARMTYGRATPTELATVLLSLNRVTQEFKAEEAATCNTQSSLIEANLMSLTSGKLPVQTYLNQISIKEARANNKADLFPDPDLYPAIQTSKDNIAIIDTELREHLREIRKILHLPSLEYVSVAGADYLVEVRQADAKKVPVEWLRISATKAMVRFHTPEVIRLTKIRDQHKETLDAAAEEAFSGFISDMCKNEYVALRNVVASLATLDVLVSLAEVANASGYTRPVFDRTPASADNASVPVEIKGMRHPILEVVSPLPYIPNDIALSTPSSTPSILLTGCNMGGKSSTVRTLGLLIIMAQIGSFIPATSARLGIHDGVYVRMGARDSMFSGRSTFMVEVSETADVLRSVTPRSLVILDELGRGTSTYDGLCIASGVLEYLLTLPRMPNVLFISHYFQLGALEARFPDKIRNFHMTFIETSSTAFEDFDGLDESEEKGEIEFLYKLRRGIANKSFGIHCARLAGLPNDILQSASRISENMEERYRSKKQVKERKDVVRLFKQDPDEGVLVKLDQIASHTL
ncbi:DNA mismatch repair protein MutS-like, N-terminal [Kalmanozyma brasiliensis GHG001]|uniref:DNA mismatch repair protein MSH3 n=1 Tax=Kalmanozyma brasiliensis (strain GHG001) TaxID=1365824 RepID=V5EYS1_KALBG|nr:DNA mismatch repair protein MutS-like, N-terminal [Kalmanozyma brasiliensis GHG001]EST08963.1 DNA mismatch repair protein MutS-like, N-terminal [Kalmanozyma brasiliensis GHG001]